MRASLLRLCVLVGFLSAVLPACLPTKSEEVACATSDECGAGFTCDPNRNVCVCDGTATDPGCAKLIDGGTSADATADAPGAGADSAGSVDRPADGVAGDAPIVASDAQPAADTSIEPRDSGALDTAIDAHGFDSAVDSRVPDAAGTCGVNSDCTNPANGFCVAEVCVGCQAAGATACGAQVCDSASGKCVDCTADGQCTKDLAKGFCVANTCTGCNTTGATGCATRTNGKTVCATSGTSAGQCVQCTADGQCTADPAKAFCVANACTGCNTAGATGCAAMTNGKTACAVTGTLAGQCVECVDASGCTADPAKGFCVNNACTGCQNAGATACTGAKAACAVTGTLAGQCVECVDNTLCTASAAKHFCVANACTGCDKVATNPCSGATPVCAPSTTATVGGECVGCLLNSDCSGADPICDTNKCRTCKSDSECVGFSNAGVCDLAGTCPADANIIYVQNSPSCSTLNRGSGTAASPFCFPDDAVAALSATKSVIVIRGIVGPGGPLVFSPSQPVLVVGQASATIKPPTVGVPAVVSITKGEVTLRDLTISGGNDTGISVTSEAILHMDRCYVLNNQGIGIQTNASAFDIVNTVIAGNGGTTSSGVTLGSYTGTGPTKFAFNTVVNNGLIGVACGATYALTGILANSNGGLNFSPNCQIDATTSTAAPAFSSVPYHLSATSPCVNAGGNTCPPDDIDDNTRPQGTACDCGADEYKP